MSDFFIEGTSELSCHVHLWIAHLLHGTGKSFFLKLYEVEVKLCFKETKSILIMSRGGFAEVGRYVGRSVGVSVDKFVSAQ